jgi:hypothetical protein
MPILCKMGNKVYNIDLDYDVLPAGSANSTFSILSVGRELRIKSLLIDLLMENNGAILPFDQNTTQFITLAVTGSNTNISYPFTDIAGGHLGFSTGDSLTITKPGQYFFDCFYASNRLNFDLFIENFHANQIRYYFHIIVETEEKTMFL